MKFDVQHSTLLLVTLWGVNCQDGATQPAKTKSVIGPANTNDNVWETSGLVADLPLSEGYPAAELEVKYGNLVVYMNMTLTPEQISPTPPTVRLKGAINCMPPFTLLMVDPDMPSRSDPTFRSYMHWLVINANSTERLHEGEVAAEYEGLGALKRSGPHRYVFLAYCQGGKRLETKQLGSLWRPGYKLADLVKQAKLMGRPFGGTFFFAEKA